MRFNFSKSKQKIFKRLSCSVALMMCLVTFVPVNVSADVLVPGDASFKGVQPVSYSGNNTKDPIDGCISVKYDNLTTIPDIQNENEINLSADDIQDIQHNLSISYETKSGYDANTFCDWNLNVASRFKVVYVDVKGADAYNRYNYSLTDYNDDKNLHSPINDANSKYPTISHVTIYLKVKPVEKGNLVINKTWVDSENKTIAVPDYAGNLFTLKDSKGTVVNSGNPVNGVIRFDNLNVGVYTLEEKSIPGFSATFKVDDNPVSNLNELSVVKNKDTIVEVQNRKDPEPKGSITVNKTWKDFFGNPVNTPDTPINEIFTLTKKKVVPTLTVANSEITGSVSPDNKTLTYGNLCLESYELKEKELEGFTPVFKVNGQIREATHIQGCGWFLTIDVCSEQVITIDVTNKKDEPKGEITVSKKWVDFQGHLIDIPKISLGDIINLYSERPVLDIAPANNRINGTLSQDNKSLTFINLENGRYLLKESKLEDFTPEFMVNGTAVTAQPTENGGWQLELTVDGDHKETAVQITNRKADPKGKIIVSKTWVDYKGTPIGALDIPLDEIFTLTEKNLPTIVEKNNDIQVVLSDENDILSFENLDNGTYILKEKKLDGYTPVFKIGDRVINATQTSDGDREIELNINADSKEIAVDVTNRKDEPKAGITVKKTWTDSSDKSITGPEAALTDLFTLKNEKGDIINGAVLKNGVLTWEGLSLGTYTLEEKKVDGYETSITLNGTTVKADKVTLTLNADKQLLKVNVTNKEEAAPVIVPVDPEAPLPKTDKTFGEEYLIIILGILAFGTGAVLRFRMKNVK